MKRRELVVCVPGLAQLSGSEAELTGKENLQRERGEERRGCQGAEEDRIWFQAGAATSIHPSHPFFSVRPATSQDLAQVTRTGSLIPVFFP